MRSDFLEWPKCGIVYTVQPTRKLETDCVFFSLRDKNKTKKKVLNIWITLVIFQVDIVAPTPQKEHVFGRSKDYLLNYILSAIVSLPLTASDNFPSFACQSE